MSSIRLVSGIMIGLGFMLFSIMAGAQPVQEEGSFAVVELFTSEGCSSCPAADDVLAELAIEAERTGLPIYPIAWHVDYWNYLGWTDPYSNAANSRRQQLYAARLPSQVYTPQMIINGQRVVRPAQRLTSAQSAVRAEIGKGGRYSISLKQDLRGRELNVEYSIDSLPPNALIGIVVVESGLSNHVTRGENARQDPDTRQHGPGCGLGSRPIQRLRKPESAGRPEHR